jgi:OPA family glycerol-3-phosphate transporter-like MFS transporter/OPA family sugar phosphate sensor protein UhpC-like MFS transporter
MLGRILAFFGPAPAVAPIADEQEMRSTFRYWRGRILYSSLIGYAVFYFVRKNLSLAMPMMEADLGISKTDLGLFLTLHGLFYGVSKFANGFLGDRANPRYFMPLGLVLSAAMNVAFGLSGTVATLGIFWLLNGWFQGMGFPPCARSITHWFGRRERAWKFAIWNTSHSIGAALILVLCGVLIRYDWRLCFFVPAGIAVVGAGFLINRLRDTPESLGLPDVEVYTGEPPPPAAEAKRDAALDFRRFVMKQVFLNPMMWVISLANFCVYTIRYAFLDWGPTLLYEMKGIHLQMAGWKVAGYELAGIAGMLIGGWITDRFFRGSAAKACLFYMAACTVCVQIFRSTDSESTLLYISLMCAMGFFIYGPQALIGTIAANIATKRAAATAIGLTGLFGYASGVLSGWGLGYIVQHHGWDVGFSVLFGVAVAGVLLFVVSWNADAPREPEPPSPAA